MKTTANAAAKVRDRLPNVVFGNRPMFMRLSQAKVCFESSRLDYFLLDQLPNINLNNNDDLDSLLPWNVKLPKLKN